MVNPNANTCWEYFNCPKNIREKCVVFKLKMGEEGCYVEHLKKGCPYIKTLGIKDCFDCPWYKKVNK